MPALKRRQDMLLPINRLGVSGTVEGSIKLTGPFSLPFLSRPYNLCVPCETFGYIWPAQSSCMCAYVQWPTFFCTMHFSRKQNTNYSILSALCLFMTHGFKNAVVVVSKVV